MLKLDPNFFRILNDEKVEKTLFNLFTEAKKEIFPVLMHLFPKIFQIYGKGIDWKTENLDFYKDKYISITPRQGIFLYMQARAVGAKNIVEFGTSYGISTLFLGKAAKDNGGKVITCEYLPEKCKIARENFEKAGLSQVIEVWEGDALETLKNIDHEIDFLLLDGWPDLVFPVFKLLEKKLKNGAVICVDDVQGFQASMKDYLDYVRSPANGYLSATIRPDKKMEFTIKNSTE